MLYLELTPVFPKPLSSFKQENFVVDPVSNSVIGLYASSTELMYSKLSASLPSSKGSRFKIRAMLFLFVPQESWDLQLRMFGYVTRGFPTIFGYVLQAMDYFIPVPLDRGGFGEWNLMLTNWCISRLNLMLKKLQIFHHRLFLNKFARL